MTKTLKKHFIKDLYNRIFDFNTFIYDKNNLSDLNLLHICKQLFSENTYFESRIRNLIDSSPKIAYT